MIFLWVESGAGLCWDGLVGVNSGWFDEVWFSLV